MKTMVELGTNTVLGGICAVDEEEEEQEQEWRIMTRTEMRTRTINKTTIRRGMSLTLLA
jgi:hypothetical protein